MSNPPADAVGEDQATPGPLSHPAREKLVDAIFAVSLGNLCLVRAWFPSLFDAYDSYFNKLAVTRATLAGLLIEWACLALVAWLGIRTLRRFHSPWLRFTLHLLFFLSLLLPADFIRLNELAITDHQAISWLKRPLIFIASIALAAAILWQHRLAARAFGTLVGILFPLALMILGRILLLFFGVQQLALQPGDPHLAPFMTVHPGQPRVLWVLFDETDMRLSFEQRPAHVQLPEMDRLRGESLFATNAFPPGDSTLQSVPGLLTGRQYSEVAVQGLADLKVTLAKDNTSSCFNPQASIFASARALGVNSAVVGWYHPYERLFGSSLAYCAWHPASEPERAPTFSETVTKQLGCLLGPIHARQLYINLCRTILPEALQAATNANCGLVFLHLPPPHRPGIYLPQSEKFTCLGIDTIDGYFNNLVLADHWLGALRQSLESSRLSDRTWIILSSDHSWRRSAVYDGRRDLRVPFIIKSPGPAAPAIYGRKLNTVLTQGLILALFKGEVASQKDAVAWLDGHRAESILPIEPASVQDRESNQE